MFNFKKENRIIPNGQSQLLGGLFGVCVGDALGVPFEFLSRKNIRECPCEEMVGYGTHNQRPGTWSDDSSLMLCTVESLVNDYDVEDIGKKFTDWFYNKLWTPYGNVFDIGCTTQSALKRINNGGSSKENGANDEQSNGNGSLMRILPMAYFLKDYDERKFEIIGDVSAITHGHIHSKIACSIYVELAINLLKGDSAQDSYDKMKPVIIEYYTKRGFGSELKNFDRLLCNNIKKYKERDIKSSGYVIHTLEASIWCLLNASSYSSTVLPAINLGGDTDTTGAVAGGLAGIYYGIENIPKEWTDCLARKDDIQELLSKYYNSMHK